jgi:hypothetical protein
MGLVFSYGLGVSVYLFRHHSTLLTMNNDWLAPSGKGNGYFLLIFGLSAVMTPLDVAMRPPEVNQPYQ